MLSSTRARHPILFAIGLLIAFEVVSIGSTLVLDRLTALDGKARDLVTEAVLAGAVVGLVAVFGWWRSIGFSTPVHGGRNHRLLVLPIAITFLPLLGGVRQVDAGTVSILVVGYVLNSLAEDGMFRGIVPRVLRGRGLLTAVVLS